MKTRVTDTKDEQIKRFVETINPVLEKLKTALLSRKEITRGSNACFEMSIDDNCAYAYEHISQYLVDIAPTVTKTRYLTITKTVRQISDCLHTFYIPHNKLPLIYSIMELNVHRCLPNY
jgi:hypothetical protein